MRFALERVSGSSGKVTSEMRNVTVYIRALDGGPVHPNRIVTSQGTTQPINPANGRNLGNIPKAAQRSKSHIVLPEKKE